MVDSSRVRSIDSVTVCVNSVSIEALAVDDFVRKPDVNASVKVTENLLKDMRLFVAVVMKSNMNNLSMISFERKYS